MKANVEQAKKNGKRETHARRLAAWKRDGGPRAWQQHKQLLADYRFALEWDGARTEDAA